MWQVLDLTLSPAGSGSLAPEGLARSLSWGSQCGAATQCPGTGPLRLRSTDSAVPIEPHRRNLLPNAEPAAWGTLTGEYPTRVRACYGMWPPPPHGRNSISTGMIETTELRKPMKRHVNNHSHKTKTLFFSCCDCVFETEEGVVGSLMRSLSLKVALGFIQSHVR